VQEECRLFGGCSFIEHHNVMELLHQCDDFFFGDCHRMRSPSCKPDPHIELMPRQALPDAPAAGNLGGSFLRLRKDRAGAISGASVSRHPGSWR
jgi:hypothetical protein